MAVNDVLELAVVYTSPISSGDMVNVVHYRQTTYDGVSSRAALGIALGNAFASAVNANYMPTVSSQITFDEVRFFYVNDPLIGGIVDQNNAGGGATDAVSFRTAPVVKKISDLRGRTFNGRMYLLPILETQQANGTITTAHLAILQTFVDSLRILSDGPVDNIWQMTVYSRKLSTPPTTIIDNTIQNFVINTVMGTIRGRQVVT